MFTSWYYTYGTMWLHRSATRHSATQIKQMFWSELKAPSISQVDCKWHLTKWLIRAVVSSLRYRHHPIRQTLTGQAETEIQEKDQEHSPPHYLMRWTNIQSLASRFFHSNICPSMNAKDAIVSNIHSYINIIETTFH